MDKKSILGSFQISGTDLKPSSVNIPLSRTMRAGSSPILAIGWAQPLAPLIRLAYIPMYPTRPVVNLGVTE